MKLVVFEVQVYVKDFTEDEVLNAKAKLTAISGMVRVEHQEWLGTALVLKETNPHL